LSRSPVTAKPPVTIVSHRRIPCKSSTLFIEAPGDVPVVPRHKTTAIAVPAGLIRANPGVAVIPPDTGAAILSGFARTGSADPSFAHHGLLKALVNAGVAGDDAVTGRPTRAALIAHQADRLDTEVVHTHRASITGLAPSTPATAVQRARLTTKRVSPRGGNFRKSGSAVVAVGSLPPRVTGARALSTNAIITGSAAVTGVVGSSRTLGSTAHPKHAFGAVGASIPRPPRSTAARPVVLSHPTIVAGALVRELAFGPRVALGALITTGAVPVAAAITASCSAHHPVGVAGGLIGELTGWPSIPARTIAAVLNTLHVPRATI